MPQVRAIATDRLSSRMAALRRPGATGDERAHRALLASDIERFIERPADAADSPQLPEAPPGAPIGEPSLDWLRRLEPPCTLWQMRPLALRLRLSCRRAPGDVARLEGLHRSRAVPEYGALRFDVDLHRPQIGRAGLAHAPHE